MENNLITPRAYQSFVDFLHKTLGHDLGPGKEYLLENRLGPLCQETGIASLNALSEKISVDRYGTLGRQVIERMTIQETSFFRGAKVFSNLKEMVFPKIISQNRLSGTIRILSACCSTGQEPYSLMMMLWEDFPELANWNIRITATDVSENALAKAESGIYSRFETIRGLPSGYKEKYFHETEQGYTAVPKLRESVSFSRLNLLDPFPFDPGSMDLILVRNVLIYFSTDIIQEIFRKMRRVIRNEGFLVLGESETILGKTDQFSLPKEGNGFFLPNQIS